MIEWIEFIADAYVDGIDGIAGFVQSAEADGELSRDELSLLYRAIREVCGQ